MIQIILTNLISIIITTSPYNINNEKVINESKEDALLKKKILTEKLLKGNDVYIKTSPKTISSAKHVKPLTSDTSNHDVLFSIEEKMSNHNNNSSDIKCHSILSVIFVFILLAITAVVSYKAGRKAGADDSIIVVGGESNEHSHSV